MFSGNWLDYSEYLFMSNTTCGFLYVLTHSLTLVMCIDKDCILFCFQGICWRSGCLELRAVKVLVDSLVCSEFSSRSLRETVQFALHSVKHSGILESSIKI